MSNQNEDQAENLRKQLEEASSNEKPPLEEVDIFSLPSRKEKHKIVKESKPRKQEEKKEDKKKKKIPFPIIRLLLFLFLLLIALMITYPKWIDKIGL